MLRVGPYVFKKAETAEEFEEIHRLNYRTFVSEIPQHPDTGTGRLVDKYHHKNVYFLVLEDGRLIGMLCAHDQPPFSVADRLRDPAVLNVPGRRPLEVRLLAVEPTKRNSTVFFGLVCTLYWYAQANGYTHLYISGVAERVSLYERLGFEAVGQAVVCGGASFVPMVQTVGRLPAKVQRVLELWETHVERVAAPSRPEPVCLLPGPVNVSRAVREAFHQPPLYHRGPEFVALFQKVRRSLSALVNTRGVAILNGSGTLANEAVAATIAADRSESRGVLLVNGEFGRRLGEQAARFGLNPRVLEWPWGQPWDLDEVAAALAAEPVGGWVWGVHMESSTGVLNDLPGLVRIAHRRGVRVCADCVSSLGAVPLDLAGVHLASGASGKSLGSYAGAAVVFADPAALAHLDTTRVPSYLDVAAALESPGPRYTFPSPILQALAAAVADYTTPERAKERFAGYAALGEYVRQELREAGLEPLADDDTACPVVTTFAPPDGEKSEDFVARCQDWGFALGGQSGYLAERRLVQIATMGPLRREDVAPLFRHFSGQKRRNGDLLETQVCEEELDSPSKSNEERYTTAEVLAHSEKL